MQDIVGVNMILLRIDPNRPPVKTIIHVVEDLAAGVDIAARAVHGFDQFGWILAARVVNQSTAASGVNDANTCVVALSTGAGTVASKQFDTPNPFPASNASISMGAVSNVRAVPGTVLNLAVTNGTTANPGPFLVEIDYV